MRIAIPSEDGSTIAQHTGRARGFAIYEITGNTSRRLAFRTQQAGGELHAQPCSHEPGNCAHAEEGGVEHHGHRDHGSILELIGDCEVMIACGAGPRLVNDLARRGIRLAFCREQSVEDIALRFAEGKLDTQSEGSCDHRHN